MSNPQTIQLDGDTYVRAMAWAIPAVRIVIAQRGWVFVGRYREEGDEVILTDASVIRRWGTTKGLGELVNGPLVSTVLDPVGVVRLHRLGVVAALDAPGWLS